MCVCCASPLTGVRFAGAIRRHTHMHTDAHTQTHNTVPLILIRFRRRAQRTRILTWSVAGFGRFIAHSLHIRSSTRTHTHTRRHCRSKPYTRAYYLVSIFYRLSIIFIFFRDTNKDKIIISWFSVPPRRTVSTSLALTHTRNHTWVS